jgi:hypothetical protein
MQLDADEWPIKTVSASTGGPTWQASRGYGCRRLPLPT